MKRSIFILSLLSLLPFNQLYCSQKVFGKDSYDELLTTFKKSINFAKDASEKKDSERLETALTDSKKALEALKSEQAKKDISKTGFIRVFFAEHGFYPKEKSKIDLYDQAALNEYNKVIQDKEAEIKKFETLAKPIPVKLSLSEYVQNLSKNAAIKANQKSAYQKTFQDIEDDLQILNAYLSDNNNKDQINA